MPAVTGFSHVAFSVTDAKKTAEFFATLLDGQVMDASDAISPFHICIAGNVIVGFRQHEGAGSSFDHHNIGLDHVAFAVESPEELEKWRGRLGELGVTNSGVITDASGQHLNARAPDNIPIEFYVLPS